MNTPDSCALAGGGARERVIDTALQLFSERGYFNTSIPDIVRRSGVSTGSIYHHFGDKEGIARSLFETTVERMELALQTICQRHRDARSRCHDIMALLFDIAEKEPALMQFMLYARHREFLSDRGPICSSKPFRMMRAVVAEGMARGDVRTLDETVAAASVFGAAIRLIQMYLDGVIEPPLARYFEDTWSCSWRSVSP